MTIRLFLARILCNLAERLIANPPVDHAIVVAALKADEQTAARVADIARNN